MKPRSTAALLTMVLWAGLVRSQDPAPKVSAHNFNGQGCASCHVVRGVQPLPQAADACDKTLLWDCGLPGRTFHTYDQPVKSHASDPEAAPLGDTEVRMSSLLCASCHDGVSTPSMSGTAGFNAHSNTPAAKGLQSEHPINVAHDPVKDPTLAALASVSRLVKLFGRANTVQCSSCHDPHDSPNKHSLRMTNNDSELCLTCHL